MKRHLIAAIAAGSLALTGMTATPASALTDREQKALALIVGLGVAGLIINDNQRNRGHSASAGRRIPGECVYDIRTAQGLRSVVSQSCAQDAGVRRLPAECGFDIRSSGGTRTVFGTRCLHDSGFRIEDAHY